MFFFHLRKKVNTNKNVLRKKIKIFIFFNFKKN